jgi:hypothetical protein
MIPYEEFLVKKREFGYIRFREKLSFARASGYIAEDR